MYTKVPNEKEWERVHSTLYQMTGEEMLTYHLVRDSSCREIVSRLTKKIDTEDSVIEIPQGEEFHLLGRVSTMQFGRYIASSYYEACQKRKFLSFSTVHAKNISIYQGRPFLLYDIHPEDIVHIFPTDSDTSTLAKTEEELTYLPSLWLNLEALEQLTDRLGVYNQITCRTVRCLRPWGVLAISEVSDEVRRIAKEFQVKPVLVHPEEDVICYQKDLLYDSEKLKEVNEVLNREYGLKLRQLDLL